MYQKLKRTCNRIKLKILRFDTGSLYKFIGIFLPIVYFIVLVFVSLLNRKSGNYGVETDFFWSYVPQAKSFLEGKIIIDGFRGPIYPIILGILSIPVNDFFFAGILISIISASFTLYFTFKIVTILSDQKLAFLLIIFLSVNPIFIQYSYTCGTDMLFNLFTSMTIWAYLKQNDLQISKIILIGILSGTTYLTRYNGLFLLIIPIVLFLQFNKYSSRKRFFFSLLFVASFLITIMPWGIYCLINKGDFFFNKNYLNVAFEIYNKGVLDREEFWYGDNQFNSFYDVISYNFLQFIQQVFKNFYRNFVNDIEIFFGWFLGIFFFIGILLKFLGVMKDKEISYIIINLSFTLPLSLVFYGERFSLFLLPFYLYFITYVFYFAIQHLVEKKYKYLIYAIISIIFCWIVYGSFSYNSFMINSGPKYNEIIKLFEEKVPVKDKGLKLAARKPYLAYQLGLEFQVIPFADSVKELISKLKEEKIDYLYWGGEESISRPLVKFPSDKDSCINLGVEELFSIKNKATFYKIVTKNTPE